MSYDNDNILSTRFHYFGWFHQRTSKLDLQMTSLRGYCIIVIIKCIGFVQTCFQSQTYSFEVAQEHIETLQRK